MGLFIAFEGPDGSGKSTQIKLLRNYLEEKVQIPSKNLIMTREPGGTDLSEKIRIIILSTDYSNIMTNECEALLYAAARAQHVNELIKPALLENKIVLCDRFVMSSYMYQGIGRKLGIKNIKLINDFATNNVTPDLTICILVNYETMMKRKQNMMKENKNVKLDRLENEPSEFHNKVYDAYIKLAKKDKNIILIDGNRSVSEIHREIRNIVLRKIVEIYKQENQKVLIKRR